MPIKLDVGISKKLGLPDDGGIGASCHVELEFDESLIASDPDGLEERARLTFAACGQAIEDELAHHRLAGESAEPKQPAGAPASDRNGNGHRGSQKQVDCA